MPASRFALRSQARTARILIGLVCGIVLVAAAIVLSTRNEWDEAPVCASTPAAADQRCVTETQGMIEQVGLRTCFAGRGGCTSLPVDIRFADGSERHLEFGGDRISAFFDGGPRDMRVVEDAYDSGGRTVIGRFHDGYLVGLRFPTTGASLATDDYPQHRLHTAAFFVMFLSPIAALLAWGLWTLASKRARRQGSA